MTEQKLSKKLNFYLLLSSVESLKAVFLFYSTPESLFFGGEYYLNSSEPAETRQDEFKLLIKIFIKKEKPAICWSLLIQMWRSDDDIAVCFK